MRGLGRLRITPPDADALRVKWLMCNDLGLFARDKLDGQKFPTVLAELRGQALVGYNQPTHNPHDMPWITDKAFDALYKRITRLWENFDDDTADELNEEIEKVGAMLVEKPRALRSAPPIDAAHLVEGVQVLLKIYPESSSWRPIDRVNALANWWGTTPAKIQRRLEDLDFGCEVQDLSERIAKLFWSGADLAMARIGEELQEAHRRVSDAEQALALERLNKGEAERRAEEAEEALAQVQTELRQAREEAAHLRSENEELKEALRAAQAGAISGIEPVHTLVARRKQVPTSAGAAQAQSSQIRAATGARAATPAPEAEPTTEAGLVRSNRLPRNFKAEKLVAAVCSALKQWEPLWRRRLAGEESLSFVERVKMVSSVLNVDHRSLSAMLAKPGVMAALVQENLGAAAFIGFDLESSQHVNGDRLTTSMVYERVKGRIIHHLTRKPGQPIEVSWMEILGSIQGTDPHALIASYLFYHRFFDEIATSTKLRDLGRPPLPSESPWPPAVIRSL